MNATIALTTRPRGDCAECEHVPAHDRIVAAAYLGMLVLVVSFLALVGLAALGS